MIKRTKLQKGKETETVSESYNSPLAASGSEPLEDDAARDYVATAVKSIGGGFKVIISTVVFVLLVLLGVHTALAGSLMFSASSDDRSATERLWVARGTFMGGQIAPETIVYGSTTTIAPTNFLDRVIEGYVGADDYFVAEVVAGPVAVVESKDGKIFASGKDTGHLGDIDRQELKNQYLAECIEGSCEKGSLVVADYDSISGEVRGVIYPFGMDEIQTGEEDGTNGTE